MMAREPSYAVRNNTEITAQKWPGVLSTVPSPGILTKVCFANQDLGTRCYIRKLWYRYPMGKMYLPSPWPE